MFLYGCGGRPVPEATVARNLRREFPDNNFEIIGLTSRRVRVGQIGVDSIHRTFYDVYVVACMDYEITFNTLDGRGQGAYLGALLYNHMSDWTAQLSGELNSISRDIYTNADNLHTAITFYTGLEVSARDSMGRRLSSIEGSHRWLRDIASFEEGFAAVSEYDGVEGVVFEITYDVTLSMLEPEVELERIKMLMREFVLPFHNLIIIEDKRTIVRWRVDFLKLDSNNLDQNVRLGRFQWEHDSIDDERMENVASFDLINYFEIAEIYDDLLLLEAVDYRGHELIGAWGWSQTPIRRYHFNEDGTGRITYEGGRDFIWRIFDDGNLLIAFEEDILWTQEGSSIRIINGPNSRIIPYAINGYHLDLNTTEGRIEINGEPIVRSLGDYIRIEWPSHLQGTWAWEMDNSWVTVMYGDGTGHRGFPDDILHFRWAVETETRNLRKVRENYQREQWSYEFDGDVLVLINWYIEDGEERGQRFRYMLVE